MEKLSLLGGRRAIKVQITSKGQATIPQEFREKYDLDAPGSAVWIDEGDKLVLRRVLSPDEMWERLRRKHGRRDHSGTDALLRDRAWEKEHDERKFGP